MLEMVLLELLVVLGKSVLVSQSLWSRCSKRSLLMMQEVVRHVVACIAKYAAAVGCRCRVPVPENDSMCKFPERCCQRNKKRRWHDKPVLVHGQIVMNAVQEEMECNANTIIGQMATCR